VRAQPRLDLAVAALAALFAAGCGHKSSGTSGGSAAVSAAPSSSAVRAVAPSTDGSAATNPAGSAPPVGEFIGARGLKACNQKTIEVASYQQRGDVSLGGQKSGVAATWMVHLAGRREEQVAFAGFDGEGKPAARTRGVSFASSAARVFGTGKQWAVTWFDSKGVAYAQPHAEPLPPPTIGHFGAAGPDLQEDVAVSGTSGALIAAAPFGADKAQLGLFQFAPEDTSQPAVKAIGVTHHANKPHRPAVAANEAGTFIAWQEPDGRFSASHFDRTGKETETACVIAPPSARKRERLALATVGAGAVAMWMEEGSIQTRALDKAGCPISPAWTIAEGRWPQLASLGEAAVVAWVASDGRYLAAKLAANGAPPAKGLDVAEGSTGVLDPPAIAAMEGKVAFGWAEVMSSTVSSKRVALRIINSDCFP
jgi:hypothetical protein